MHAGDAMYEAPRELLGVPLLLAPPPCSSPPPRLLLLVPSSPGNAEQRSAVRSTWGAPNPPHSRTVFGFGVPVGVRGGGEGGPMGNWGWGLPGGPYRGNGGGGSLFG